LAVFERSAIALAQLDTKKDVLLLDCLQDPGNVGALIRSAAASNWQQVICLDGTADPYNIKAVRASAGAIGAVRLSHGNSFEESLSFLRDNKYTLLNTVIGSSTSQLASLVREERQRCLILGSEGQGSREQWRYASDLHPVSLPMMHPLVESLNVAVAGSMLLYKLHDLL
jgi:TrmH family RNA methyltransferase